MFEASEAKPAEVLRAPMVFLFSDDLPGGGIPKTSRVIHEAQSTDGYVGTSSVFERRANAPVAVLLEPVVLLRSAPAPIPVFESALFNASVPAPAPVL
jgi:hypothetical protein